MNMHADDPISTLVPLDAVTGDTCPTIAFDPESRWLATDSLLWDLSPTASVVPQPFWLPGVTLTFDPGARYVVTVTQAEPGEEPARVTLRFVPLETGALIEQACLLAGRNPSREEWRRFFRGEPYRAICPHFPTPGTQ